MGTETERARAAGFHDGEGCVAVNKRPTRPTAKLQLSIAQVDDRPLRRFQRAVGQDGSLTLQPECADRPGRPLWWLHYADEGTIEVAWALWPYLSEPKREQVIRAIQKVWHINQERAEARILTPTAGLLEV